MATADVPVLRSTRTDDAEAGTLAGDVAPEGWDAPVPSDAEVPATTDDGAAPGARHDLASAVADPWPERWLPTLLAPKEEAATVRGEAHR